MKQIEDTVKHKKLVIDACYKLQRWLFSRDRDEEAFELLRRGQIHDDSKFYEEELKSLQMIPDSNNGMRNPKYTMTDADRKCIEIHWKNNRHHPEHFKDIREMTDVDIMEMVCDWYARSEQFGTNFMNFVMTRQENRFHFPQDMFEKIVYYCNILEKT